MRPQIEKLDDVDVFFSTRTISEEEHLLFSEFLRKRKLDREKRAVTAARRNATKKVPS